MKHVKSSLALEKRERVNIMAGVLERLSKFKCAKSTDTFLYFAFGSNLSSERILVQNPSAKYLTTALLKGYKLNFDAFSTRYVY